MCFNVISVHGKRLHRKMLKYIGGCLKYLFWKNIGKNNTDIFMYVMHHIAV